MFSFNFPKTSEILRFCLLPGTGATDSENMRKSGIQSTASAYYKSPVHIPYNAHNYTVIWAGECKVNKNKPWTIRIPFICVLLPTKHFSSSFCVLPTVSLFIFSFFWYFFSIPFFFNFPAQKQWQWSGVHVKWTKRTTGSSNTTGKYAAKMHVERWRINRKTHGSVARRLKVGIVEGPPQHKKLFHITAITVRKIRVQIGFRFTIFTISASRPLWV